MVGYRTLIIIGQVGRIWAKRHFTRQLYQTATAIGFYGLMTKAYRDRDEYDSDITVIGSKRYIIHSGTIENKPQPFRLKQITSWK